MPIAEALFSVALFRRAPRRCRSAFPIQLQRELRINTAPRPSASPTKSLQGQALLSYAAVPPPASPRAACQKPVRLKAARARGEREPPGEMGTCYGPLATGESGEGTLRSGGRGRQESPARPTLCSPAKRPCPPRQLVPRWTPARRSRKPAASATAPCHAEAAANDNKSVYFPKSRGLRVPFAASCSKMVFTRACQREFEVCGLRGRRCFRVAGGSDWAGGCFEVP